MRAKPEQIFDGVAVDPALPPQLQEQLEALRVLMMLAFRAGLAFAVSPAVIEKSARRTCGT